MVLHDDLSDEEKKLKFIRECGYDLVEYFQLPEDVWWLQYYEPLEIKINGLLEKHDNDPEILKQIKRFLDEIDMYKKNPSAFRSIFYIIQKIK